MKILNFPEKLLTGSNLEEDQTRDRDHQADSCQEETTKMYTNVEEMGVSITVIVAPYKVYVDLKGKTSAVSQLSISALRRVP